ncbi:hypothetical protein AN639_11765 [Candidatus Epulonipiscium fishelsonii]|uniref:Uncharacterized protein n=1 Tax=Candidatus Epulonipiscium fishelsonii TaxID=77094 RepID=A0ACC8XCM6_9FIRM|nr:hypothetical protein AN396_05320 [Epulopiscium sp. SCG-B11WGA-EpuloA1]ONI42947.1 hypothetical protein AN639_11765 [Epulopiscium sp. SCG-B05WGA-EpuloA1]
MDKLEKRAILKFLNTEGHEVKLYITEPRLGLEDENAEELKKELQAIIDTRAYGDMKYVPKLETPIEVIVEALITDVVTIPE